MENVKREIVGDELTPIALATRTRALVAAVLSLALLAPGLWAQTNGTIQGTVTDTSNVPLSGVQISVTGPPGVKSALTDEKGFYRITGLPSGKYQLAAKRANFAPGKLGGIKLQPNQVLTMDLTLTSLTVSEQMVVTSQRRTEPLQKVPMSVTAVSSDTLQEQKVENLVDIAPLVPGLSVDSATPGQTRITLRGINTGGVASTVGVYLGDVPFGSSTGLANGAVLAGDFDTFDMKRVEVLRGPQGTLYGASALGGVFKFIPNPPTTSAFEERLLGSSETVKDGALGYSVKGLVNAPLSDRFAIRASGFYRYDNGFINSIGNNPIPSLTTPGLNVVDGTLVKKHINSANTFGGRVSALYTPSDQFSLNLMVQSQNINSDAPNTVDASPTTLKPLNSKPVQSRYQSQTVDTKYRIFSATAKWDLGPASLVSITSYGSFDQNLRLDSAIAAGLTGGPPLASVVTYYFGNDATRPLSAILPQTTSTDKFTQELRILSPQNETFEWLIGAFYTHENSKIAQRILAVDAGTENVAADIPALAVLALPSTYEEFALYGHATWHLTPRFDLSFGARASRNQQAASQSADGPLVGGHTAYERVTSSENPFTYSVSPRFQLAANSFLYARVATGFRPGGPNVLPAGAPPGTPLTYHSDRLTSYEAGWKTSTSGGRASLDLSGYYLDWKDIQLFAVVNGFGINGNGGTAVSKGGELSASFIPARGLTFSLDAAYTDAYLTKDTDPIVGGLNGDSLPYVPNWSYGLTGQYEWEAGDDLTMLVGGNVAYVGDRTFDFTTRKADGSLRMLNGYTTLGLRAGVYMGRWSFELYGKNLTNKLGVTAVDTSGDFPNGAYGLALIRPRTIGLSIGVRFWGAATHTP